MSRAPAVEARRLLPSADRPAVYHGTFPPNRKQHTDETKTRSDGGPVEVGGWKLLSLLIFTWLGSFLAAVDTTMTSTMSATISTSFGSLALIGWLGAAYLIANAAVQPLSGNLTDIFGRRTGLLFCSAAFLAGNLICGTAPTQGVLILGRAVAGIGGGGLNTISTILATDVIPLRNWGLWQGLGNLLFCTGLGLGGLVGGTINDAFGWRWAFLSLCPLTFLSAIGIFFTVPASLPHPKTVPGDSFGSRIRCVDFLGSSLLVAALFTLLLALEFGRTGTEEAMPPSASEGQSKGILLALLPASAVFFGFFIYNESRTKHPIIALPQLANRSVLCACLAGFFANMTLYTLLFNVPLFLQARGANSGLTGLLLVPEAVGSAAGSMSAGLMMRLTGNYTYLKPAVLLVFVIGPSGFAAAGWATPMWAPEIYLFACGLGLGGTLMTLLLAMIAAIDHEMQAVATSAFYAFRTIGGTIGVSSSNVLFLAVLGATEMRPETSSASDGLKGLPAGGCRGAGEQYDAVCRNFGMALRATFFMALGSAVATLVFGLLVRNESLSSSFAQDKRSACYDSNERVEDESRFSL